MLSLLLALKVNFATTQSEIVPDDRSATLSHADHRTCRSLASAAVSSSDTVTTGGSRPRRYGRGLRLVRRTDMYERAMQSEEECQLVGRYQKPQFHRIRTRYPTSDGNDEGFDIELATVDTPKHPKYDLRKRGAKSTISAADDSVSKITVDDLRPEDAPDAVS